MMTRGRTRPSCVEASPPLTATPRPNVGRWHARRRDCPRPSLPARSRAASRRRGRTISLRPVRSPGPRAQPHDRVTGPSRIGSGPTRVGLCRVHPRTAGGHRVRPRDPASDPTTHAARERAGHDRGRLCATRGRPCPSGRPRRLHRGRQTATTTTKVVGRGCPHDRGGIGGFGAVVTRANRRADPRRHPSNGWITAVGEWLQAWMSRPIAMN